MSELLEAGLVLTAVGMGVVYLMLGALVLLLGWMSKLCERLAPREGPSPGEAEAPLDAELVSAISAAVQMFRRDRGARDSTT